MAPPHCKRKLGMRYACRAAFRRILPFREAEIQNEMAFFFFFLVRCLRVLSRATQTGELLKFITIKSGLHSAVAHSGNGMKWCNFIVAVTFKLEKKHRSSWPCTEQRWPFFYSNATTDLNIMTKKQFTFTPTSSNESHIRFHELCSDLLRGRKIIINKYTHRANTIHAM